MDSPVKACHVKVFRPLTAARHVFLSSFSSGRSDAPSSTRSTRACRSKRAFIDGTSCWSDVQLPKNRSIPKPTARSTRARHPALKSAKFISAGSVANAVEGAVAMVPSNRHVACNRLGGRERSVRCLLSTIRSRFEMFAVSDGWPTHVSCAISGCAADIASRLVIPDELLRSFCRTRPMAAPVKSGSSRTTFSRGLAMSYIGPFVECRPDISVPTCWTTHRVRLPSGVDIVGIDNLDLHPVLSRRWTASAIDKKPNG